MAEPAPVQVRLVFQVKYQVGSHNERLFVVGDIAQLGSWDVSKAVALRPPSPASAPTKQDLWRLELEVPSVDFEYTYLVMTPSDREIWFSRRRLSLGGRLADPVNPVICVSDGIGLSTSLETSMSPSTAPVITGTLSSACLSHIRTPSPRTIAKPTRLLPLPTLGRSSPSVRKVKALSQRLQDIEGRLASVGRQLGSSQKRVAYLTSMSEIQHSIESLRRQFETVLLQELGNSPQTESPSVPQPEGGKIEGEHDVVDEAALVKVHRQVDETRSALSKLQSDACLLKTRVPELVQEAFQPLLQRLRDQQESIQREREDNRSLRRQIECLRGKIRVLCRVRPILESEKELEMVAIDCVNSNTLCIGSKTFAFDRVLGPHCSNADVFSEVDDLVKSVLQGYSLSIFAFGQTNSGKTHTMTGLNQGALSLLFELAQQQKGTSSYTMKLSVLEIHNNQLTDLLQVGDDRPALEIAAPGSLPQSCVRVANLTETPVTSFEHTWDLIAGATDQRKTHATNCNARSSRSHVLVCVSITSQRRDTGELSTSRLCLIDLAGSERVKISGAAGDRLRESQHINKSLSALGNVFRALADSNKAGGHVPFRDSKLTYAMQDVLDGSARCVCVVHVSPTESCVDESMCSLRFGERVKTVEFGQQARRNVQSGEYMRYKALAQQKQATINSLQAQLEAEKFKSRNVVMSPSRRSLVSPGSQRPKTPRSARRSRDENRTPGSASACPSARRKLEDSVVLEDAKPSK